MHETTPPKAVQRWSASDYARNGRFVQEMAGPVFAMLAPRPGERILDLGCGDGTLTAEIKAAGADVLGVDLSEELLAVAKMKGLAVRKLDGHALDFVSEFDAGVLQRGATLDARAGPGHHRGGARAEAARPFRG
jgi:trans-aconitate methyltransferase